MSYKSDQVRTLPSRLLVTKQRPKLLPWPWGESVFALLDTVPDRIDLERTPPELVDMPPCQKIQVRSAGSRLASLELCQRGGGKSYNSRSPELFSTNSSMSR